MQPQSDKKPSKLTLKIWIVIIVLCSGWQIVEAVKEYRQTVESIK